MKKHNLLIVLFVTTAVALASCGARIPSGVKAVGDFEPNRYLGTWYEIGRLDHRFERHLDFVTATYTMNKDSTIRVENRGYHTKKKEWKDIVGKAALVESNNVGRLKVSFFGPFYSGYNIIELDEDYRYALVIGNNTSYAWILSRTPSIPESIKNKYITKAKQLGIAQDNWIWVKHQEK